MQNFVLIPVEPGVWRYCPACARPSKQHPILDKQVCSCCERPWGACPCTPAEDGPCRAMGIITVDDP